MRTQRSEETPPERFDASYDSNWPGLVLRFCGISVVLSNAEDFVDEGDALAGPFPPVAAEGAHAAGQGGPDGRPEQVAFDANIEQSRGGIWGVVGMPLNAQHNRGNN